MPQGVEAELVLPGPDRASADAGMGYAAGPGERGGAQPARLAHRVALIDGDARPGWPPRPARAGSREVRRQRGRRHAGGRVFLEAGVDGAPNSGGNCSTVTSGGSALSQLTSCRPDAVPIVACPPVSTPEPASAVTAATVACTHIRISWRGTK